MNNTGRVFFFDTEIKVEILSVFPCTVLCLLNSVYDDYYSTWVLKHQALTVLKCSHTTTGNKCHMFPRQVSCWSEVRVMSEDGEL